MIHSLCIESHTPLYYIVWEIQIRVKSACAVYGELNRHVKLHHCSPLDLGIPSQTRLPKAMKSITCNNITQQLFHHSHKLPICFPHCLPVATALDVQYIWGRHCLPWPPLNSVTVGSPPNPGTEFLDVAYCHYRM